MIAAELKLLLALNGGQRLPHLEAEIFADKEAAAIYLNNLCRNFYWYSSNDNTTACLAFCYAIFVINGRWPEAETVITTSPQDAYYYAKHIIKTRWIKAEAVIASDPHWWASYTHIFGIVE